MPVASGATGRARSALGRGRAIAGRLKHRLRERRSGVGRARDAGISAYRAENWRQASERLAEVVELEPDDSMSGLLLARAQRNDGDLEGSLETITGTLERHPGWAPAVLHAADMHERLGDAAGARQVLAEVGALEEQDPEQLLRLTRRATELGATDVALRLARDLFEERPDDRRVRQAAIAAARESGDSELFARAREATNEAAATDHGTRDLVWIERGVDPEALEGCLRTLGQAEAFSFHGEPSGGSPDAAVRVSDPGSAGVDEDPSLRSRTDALAARLASSIEAVLPDGARNGRGGRLPEPAIATLEEVAYRAGRELQMFGGLLGSGSYERVVFLTGDGSFATVAGPLAQRLLGEDGAWWIDCSAGHRHEQPAKLSSAAPPSRPVKPSPIAAPEVGPTPASDDPRRYRLRRPRSSSGSLGLRRARLRLAFRRLDRLASVQDLDLDGLSLWPLIRGQVKWLLDGRLAGLGSERAGARLGLEIGDPPERLAASGLLAAADRVLGYELPPPDPRLDRRPRPPLASGTRLAVSDWRQINDLARGETVFVVGASPQLNRLSPEQRAGIGQARTIGLNRTYFAFPVDVFLTSYPWELEMAMSEMGEAASYVQMRRLGSAPIVPGSIAVRRKALQPWSPFPRFLVPPDPALYTRRNSAFAATHLALVMGARRIVFIGVDQSSHFHFWQEDEALRSRIRRRVEGYRDPAFDHLFVEHPKDKVMDAMLDLLTADLDELAARPFHEDHTETFTGVLAMLQWYGVEVLTTSPESVVARSGAPVVGVDAALALALG